MPNRTATVCMPEQQRGRRSASLAHINQHLSSAIATHQEACTDFTYKCTHATHATKDVTDHTIILHLLTILFESTSGLPLWQLVPSHQPAHQQTHPFTAYHMVMLCTSNVNVDGDIPYILLRVCPNAMLFLLCPGMYPQKMASDVAACHRYVGHCVLKPAHDCLTKSKDNQTVPCHSPLLNPIVDIASTVSAAMRHNMPF